jgi:NAD(P)-dependent dehydrogenase (short-subunit alcohol dehydrogenase family)
MPGRFAGKSVLVAGGTGALGRAVAWAFVEESANVTVTYHRQEELTAPIEGYEADVTDESSVRQIVEQILKRHARIDVLVNAVGGYAGGSTLWETAPAVFDQMLSLNLRSGHALSRVIVPVMLKQGSGAIINISSRMALDHGAGAAAYAASKAAALAMMDSLAAELKSTRVRVNSVLPSIFDTPANRKAMPKADFTKWPKPEEIARVILFLCSDDAGLISGAAVPVYGLG